MGTGALVWLRRQAAYVRLHGRRPPTIFHVTHWKAGSQWIDKILARCARERLVRAEDAAAQLLRKPLVAGGVYAACYVTHEQFQSVPLSEPWRRFVVIRDLRDTLVSGYFSLRFSHTDDPWIPAPRTLLAGCDLQDGLLWLLDNWLPDSAAIQRSWLESGEDVIRYEDLLKRDVDILVPLLTKQCPLGVSARRVREAVLACRFERLTDGRSRGQEDVHSHERKGVAGDWHNHFTDRLTREFKTRYGELLIAAGYEKDLDWGPG